MIQSSSERLALVKKTICRLAEEYVCDYIELETIYEVIQLKGAIVGR